MGSQTADLDIVPSYRRISVLKLRRALTQLLLEYRRELDTTDRRDRSAWIRRLFDVLGWDQGVAATLRPMVELPEAEIFQGDLFGYRAFAVAAIPPDTSRSWEERTNSVLTYLYNRGDEWAVVSDFDRLDIVNVHWTDKQRLYLPFRKLSVEDYPRDAEVLALLTPARLHQRDLYQQAQAEAPRKSIDRARPGERMLRPPITEAVLDRILASRKVFLASPPAGETDAPGYDAQIHQLLMRLIFIRACEDMGVGVSNPLKTVLDRSDPHEALRKILAAYQELYHSELFEPLNLRVFQPGPLRQAITSLYGLPGVVEFNFAAIEADILGMMYEEYLQWRAVRKESNGGDEQQVIFELERVTTENVKRQKGIYYTPSFLVEAMVDRAFEFAGAPDGWLADGRPVLASDFSCGSGAFLAMAYRKIALAHEDRSYHAAARLLTECIAGVDSDPRAVEATRLNLWLTLFRLNPEVHPLPYLSGVVVARDALLDPLVTDVTTGTAQSSLFEHNGDALGGEPPRLPRRPDVVLGNPPFVPIERLSPKYQKDLADQGYQTVTGRFDLANVFVERALDTVASGGIIALVVPNRIFSTASAASLRRVITARAVFEQVIDFGTEQVFPATTYVSVIILRRTDRPMGSGVQVPVVRVDRLIEPRGLQLREALGAGTEPPGVRRYSVRIPTAGAPVLLVPGNASGLIRRLAKIGVPVSAIAESKQGIRTGEQSLFLVVERPDVEGTEERLPVSSFGPVDGKIRTATIERAVLRPAVHSGSIQRYRLPPSGLWVVYPYESGRLIPAGEFQDRFPDAAAYLGRHRAALQRRARVTPETWHSLSLPREESWLAVPKLLVPELANEGRMTLDQSGLYLVQGFGLLRKIGAPVDLPALLGVLNSTLLVWQTALNTPRFRGNAFRYHSAALEALTLPSDMVEDAGFRDSMAELVGRLTAAYSDPKHQWMDVGIPELEAEIDAMVYAAAKLNAREIRLVEDEVARFRPPLAVEFDRGALASFQPAQGHPAPEYG